MNASKDISNVVNNLKNGVITYKESFGLLSQAMSKYSLEAVKSTLIDSGLDKAQIRLILSSKGLKDKTLEDAVAQVIDAQAKKVNEEATEELIKDELGLKYAVGGLKDTIIKFATSTVGKLTIATTALALLGTAIYNWQKADEEALESSKERLNELSNEYESITSEVDGLEGQISSLNQQIGELDPITDAEQIQALKDERAELEQEVALLKQRQEYLAQEEGKTAEETLNKKVSSKYTTDGYNELSSTSTGDMAGDVGRTLGYLISNQGFGDQVTEYEELELAMQRVNDLEKQRNELKKQQGELDEKDPNYDKDYNELKTQIENFDTQITETEKDVSTLASSVQSSWAKLPEGKLKDSIGGILVEYFELTGAVDAATASFDALSKAQQKNILVSKLQEQGLDDSTIQSILSNISEDDYAKLFSIDLPSIGVLKSQIENELKELEKGGSVNLTLRPTIDTSELNAKGWDAGEGVATVFSSTFSNEDGSVAVNFTPIIADPVTGEYLGVLTPDELQEYAEGVIAGTRKDDLNLQIGSVYKGEDAIEQAENDAENIHNLHESYFTDETTNAESYGKAYADAWYDGLNQGLEEGVDDFANKTGILSTEELNKNINTAYDSISKSYDAVKEFKDAMSNGGMTDSALDAVANLSDELKALVGEFYAGTISADELFETLTDHYNNDLKNYGDAIIAKNQYSEEFYNTIGLNDTEFVNHMLDNYGVDISNCKTYAEAKLKIEQELLKNVSGMWSKYYDVQAKSFTQEWTKLNTQIDDLERHQGLEKGDTKSISFGADTETLEDLKKVRNAVQSFVNPYEAAIEELNNIAYNGIESSFDGINSNIDSSSSSAKETAETIDWIDTLLSRIQRTISNLDKTASATYKRWSIRNSALTQELSAVNKEISLQQSAYSRYMYEADRIGLAEHYERLVQNGALDISTITDETLKKQIDTYTEYYNKALECADAVQELKNQLAELAITGFENLVSEYEDKLSSDIHTIEMLEGRIDQLESKGYTVSADSYSKLISTQQSNIALLEKEYEHLKTALDTAVNDGNIQQYSEAWYDMIDSIRNVQKEIEDANSALIEYQNTLRELEWDKFDKILDKLSDITEETDFLNELMSDKKLFDDNGNTTEYGQASFGLLALNYQNYMEQTKQYADEMLKIDKELANDPYNTVLFERRQELLELQQDAIKSAKDEQKAILDLKREGYDKLLDSMGDIIDKRKDMLSQIKNLYDYEKSITEQTDEVARLEKIINSMQGMADTEYGKSTIQQYKVQLEEARQNLEETEYERYLNDQQSMLDTIYNETEAWVSQRMDESDEILAEVLEETKKNTSVITETLNEVASEVGYTNSGEFSSAIVSITDAVMNISNLMTNLPQTITSAFDGLADLFATVNHEGWKQSSDGSWSYYQNGEKASNQWVKHTDGKWYHLNGTGTMDANTWIQNDSGTWSYVDGSGAAVTGWHKLDWNGQSDWYAFDDEGTMKANEWVGDYFVGASGKMLAHTWVGHNGVYYYVGDDGKWLNLPGWTSNTRPDDGYPIYEYAKGSRRIPFEQLARVGEKGQELQYDSSEGELRVLGKEDMVFNNDQTKFLYDFSKDGLTKLSDLKDVTWDFASLPLPQLNLPILDYNKLPQLRPAQNITVEFGDTNVTLTNVRDANEFAKEIKNVYAHNIGQVKTMVRQDVLGSGLGKNMEAFKYL